VNKHLYLCHLLVLSSPTLMMHGHTNLKRSASMCCCARTCKYYILRCALTRQASTVEFADIFSNPTCGLSISVDTNALPPPPISPNQTYVYVPKVPTRVNIITTTTTADPLAMPQMSTTMQTHIVVSFIITLGIHYNSSIRGAADKLFQWSS